MSAGGHRIGDGGGEEMFRACRGTEAAEQGSLVCLMGMRGWDAQGNRHVIQSSSAITV